MDDAVNTDTLRRTMEELQVERGRLSHLLELATQLVSNLDLRTLLRTASTTARRVMQCNAVAVHLPDRESVSLRLFALDSPDGSRTEQTDASWLEGSSSREDVCEGFRSRNGLLDTKQRSCAVP